MRRWASLRSNYVSDVSLREAIASSGRPSCFICWVISIMHGLFRWRRHLAACPLTSWFDTGLFTTEASPTQHAMNISIIEISSGALPMASDRQLFHFFRPPAGPITAPSPISSADWCDNHIYWYNIIYCRLATSILERVLNDWYH